MKILVSGATRTFDRLWPRWSHHLGRLVQPHSRNRWETILKPGMMWGVDNAAFSNWSWKKFADLVEEALPRQPDWIVMPDFVGSASGTIHMFDGYYSILEDGSGENPWAIVGQDGMEDMDFDWWFGHAVCFFIGGSTKWKLSQAAADLAGEAKRRGMLVHMGRVNSNKRLAHAFRIGCDSVDGTGYSMYPAATLSPALQFLESLEGTQQTNLFDERTP